MTSAASGCDFTGLVYTVVESTAPSSTNGWLVRPGAISDWDHWTYILDFVISLSTDRQWTNLELQGSMMCFHYSASQCHDDNWKVSWNSLTISKQAEETSTHWRFVLFSSSVQHCIINVARSRCSFPITRLSTQTWCVNIITTTISTAVIWLFWYWSW